MPAFHTPPVGHRSLAGITAAIVLAASSCASEPEIVRDPSAPAVNVHATVVTTDAGFPNDPIAIDSARVSADTLIAAVSHGGGCSDHSYQLVVGSAWMESFPVQVRARIAHNANGDNCRALLHRELRMSLRPLADAYRMSYNQQRGSVSIQLTGATRSLLYTF